MDQDSNAAPRTGAFTRPMPGRDPDAEPAGVERQLAQYAFIREERDREVRLLFRDVPADEVARAFRASGASLITIYGERLTPAVPTSDDVSGEAGTPPGEDGTAPRRHRKRRAESQSTPVGEALLRYFYSLGEIVYTVGIAVPSGVVASVAGVYPVAALSEHEIRDRIAVVFKP
ncbi:MAG TPA: hypothetical protein VFH60_11470 [Chloroflexia bacterium]|nr:hypothetical protein [Chloroflexia bacterium]